MFAVFKSTSLVLGLVLTAQFAHANNDSRYQAFEISADSFEIVADYSDNAVYWCGAATHALTALSRPTSQMLFVQQGPSQSLNFPAKKSVKFAFSAPPQADPVNRFSNDVSAVGNSMTIAAARQYCFDTLVND